MASGTIRKPTPTLVLEGNHGSTSVAWTAPYDGFAVAVATWDTSHTLAYWYINDTTANINLGRLSTADANGAAASISFPLIKGHVYDGTQYAAHLSSVSLYCYKYA